MELEEESSTDLVLDKLFVKTAKTIPRESGVMFMKLPNSRPRIAPKAHLLINWCRQAWNMVRKLDLNSLEEVNAWWPYVEAAPKARDVVWKSDQRAKERLTSNGS